MDSEFYALELSCEAAQDMPCAATQDIYLGLHPQPLSTFLHIYVAHPYISLNLLIPIPTVPEVSLTAFI